MRLCRAAHRLVPAFVLTVAAVTPAFAKTVLPDACGDPKIQFEITEKPDQPAPSGPEDGKALLVFVGTAPSQPFMPQTRFGIDGSWVGATQSHSYFVVPVTPGLHHVCATVQGGFVARSLRAAVPLDVTAEAGKVYYFEAHSIVVNSAPSMPGGSPGQRGSASFSFAPLSEAEGKYRLKAWALSVSTPKR